MSAERRAARAYDLAVDLAGLSDTGRVRKNNEDHFLVVRFGRHVDMVSTNLLTDSLPEDPVDAGAALLVADGMGAHAAGEVASRLALATMLELAYAVPDWILRLDESLAATAERRNHAIFRGASSAIAQRAEADPRLKGMGTTVTSAVSLGLDLRVTHVGDSRAYLLREGKLLPLTRDHTLAQELLDQGRDHSVAKQFRHLLTRSIGAKDPKPATTYWRLADGDRLLVCSDGLTDMVDEGTISHEMGRHATAKAVCRGLVRRALDGGGADNVTAAVAIYSLRKRSALAGR